MSDKSFSDQQFIVSQSEFIKELTNSCEDEDATLGKRPIKQDLQEESSDPRKLLIVQKAFSDSQEKPAVPQVFFSALDEISSITSPFSSQDAMDNETDTSTLELINPEDHHLRVLMQNQFDCQKVLVKHFLLETIINEKFNLARFNILPGSCQKLILAFLRTHFNFDLASELRTGTHKKHLYGLHGRHYSAAEGSRVSLSFVTDCYLYGLRKQLQSTGQCLDQQQTIKTLHSALFPQSGSSHLHKFEETIENLLKYDTGDIPAGVSAILSYPLIAKMSQISEKTLRKFFSVKLHKCLSLLIDDAKSFAELKKNFSCRKQTIDILSAYIGLEQECPKQYRISVLNITNNTSI